MANGSQPQIHNLEDHNYSFPALLEKYHQLTLAGQLKPQAHSLWRLADSCTLYLPCSHVPSLKLGESKEKSHPKEDSTQKVGAISKGVAMTMVGAAGDANLPATIPHRNSSLRQAQPQTWQLTKDSYCP